MNNLINLPYNGLHTVISGGQTGSDQAGLFTAAHFNLRTGGFISKGFRTQAGPAPFLAEFGLVETTSANYPPRTKKNAEWGDATIRLASNFNSAGEILTLNYCKAAKKPHFDVRLDGKDYDLKVAGLVDFLINHSIGCLNIAGNSDRDNEHGFHFINASKILTDAFTILQNNNLLITHDNHEPTHT